MTALPVLYSFRRCPYAMRARMAILQSGQTVELREIVLRDKPTEMIDESPKATVPVLVLADGTVIDESLDVAKWALNENDPSKWLMESVAERDVMFSLIVLFDEKFKHHLDHTKYATRHAPEGVDVKSYSDEHRAQALAYLDNLEERFAGGAFLFGERQTLADIAIFPFVRQFANTDTVWFEAQSIPNVQNWLNKHVTSNLFTAVMEKYPRWESGSKGLIFND